jgi:Domain of unknown function (DUF4166)
MSQEAASESSLADQATRKASLAYQATSQLFASLLGKNFEALPTIVQQVHSGKTLMLTGTARVTRGPGLLSRLFALAARLPAAIDETPVQVHIERLSHLNESWQRQFGPSKMPSLLSGTPDGSIRERLGLVCFDFQLQTCADLQGFDWIVKRVRVFGLLPMPASWFSEVRAKSYAEDGRYRFLVHAQMPIIGLLVRYEGDLSILLDPETP